MLITMVTNEENSRAYNNTQFFQLSHDLLDKNYIFLKIYSIHGLFSNQIQISSGYYCHTVDVWKTVICTYCYITPVLNL